jgi:WD40 repeat protein
MEQRGNTARTRARWRHADTGTWWSAPALGILLAVWLSGSLLGCGGLPGPFPGRPEQVAPAASQSRPRASSSGGHELAEGPWWQQLRQQFAGQGGLPRTPHGGWVTLPGTSGQPGAPARQTHGGLRIPLGHDQEWATAVAFAPDGRLALSGGVEGTLILWEVDTGRQLRIFRHADEFLPIVSLTFTPDGRAALAGSVYGAITRWDVTTGRVLRTMRVDNAQALAFAPDGRSALVGGLDGTLRLWDVDAGRAVRTFRGHTRTVSAGTFSRDGRLALSGSHDQTLKLWEVATGRELHTLRGHTGAIEAVAFSPDSRFALSGGTALPPVEGLAEGLALLARSRMPGTSRTLTLSAEEQATVKFWDLSTGQELRRLAPALQQGKAVAFSPDGRSALVGGVAQAAERAAEDRAVATLWEVATGQELRPLRAHFHEVQAFLGNIGGQAVAFSPDGRLVLTGSLGGLKLFDVATGRERRPLRGHLEEVRSVTLSPDGRWLLAASMMGELTLWEMATGQRKRSFRKGALLLFQDTLFGHHAVFSSDSRRILAMGSRAQRRGAQAEEQPGLVLWEVETDKAVLSSAEPSGSVTALALAPDGRLALTGSYAASPTSPQVGPPLGKLWDMTTGRLLRELVGHSATIEAVALAPDSRFALSASADKTVKLWEVATGRLLHTFPDDGSHGRLAFSADSRLALIGHSEWEVATGRPLHRVAAKGGITSFLAPNGQEVMGVGDRGLDENVSGVIKLPGNKRAVLLHGHSSEVNSMAFTPDGGRAVSGSRDGTIRLWGLRTAQEIALFAALPDGEWMTVTPDGYYDSSLEGSEWVYWAPPTGDETFSMGQFAAPFHRPEVLRARLAGESSAGTPAPPFTPPPRIDMPDHQGSRDTTELTYPLRFTVQAPQAVATVRIVVNGKPTLELPVPAPGTEMAATVPLGAGANRLTVIAYAASGVASQPRYVDVRVTRTARPLPALHVLAVGVSRYPRLSSFAQLHAAHTDAQAFVQAFRQQEGQLYRKVSAQVLTNAQVSSAVVRAQLEALSTVDAEDLVLLFFAGHGAHDRQGTFYFLTPDGHEQEPGHGGINWEHLGAALTRIKGRVVVFLDACHSGSLTTPVVPNDELARRLFTDRHAGVIVFAASKGRQSALEGEDFGFFTRAITQGVGPEARLADANGNGFVEVRELVDYVRSAVDERSQGTQTPWVVRQELLGELPLARVQP